jgi:type VI secretion system protein ImpL
MSYEQQEIASVLGAAFGRDSSGKPVDPATRVDEHFAALHAFVTGSPNSPPQLDDVVNKLRAIYQGLNQAANAPNQGAALLSMVGGGGGAPAAAAQLQTVAQSVPKPIAAMLQTVSQSSAAVATSGASAQLSDAWQSKVLPLCREAFNRYPFIAGSSADVPLEDFTHLLGPGGLIDQFFDKYLQPFVDTTTTPWHWQSAEHTKLGLSPGALEEFERAAKIRDALFPNGSQMMVQFQLVPVELDPGIASVSLDIAGQRLSYAHGPEEPVNFAWPGPNGATQLRLTMTPINSGSATVIQNNGPWSLLRLMDAGHVVNSGQPDKFQVSFSSAAGRAVFELNAASVRNPFTLGALRAFRCPAKL